MQAEKPMLYIADLTSTFFGCPRFFSSCGLRTSTPAFFFLAGISLPRRNFKPSILCAKPSNDVCKLCERCDFYPAPSLSSSCLFVPHLVEKWSDSCFHDHGAWITSNSLVANPNLIATLCFADPNRSFCIRSRCEIMQKSLPKENRLFSETYCGYLWQWFPNNCFCFVFCFLSIRCIVRDCST